MLTLICLTTSQYATAATIESAQTGNWSTGSTWVGGLVPAATDDVIIKANHTVSINDNRSCLSVIVEPSASLNLVSTLTQEGAFLNQGTVNWTNGSFSGAGAITNEGILNLISDTQHHNTSVNITNNSGATINWNSGGLDNGGGGQTLFNYGTFNLIGTNPIGWTTQMAIENKSGGSIVKGGTAPAGLTIARPFTNESGGTVTVNNGASLTFASGGNLTNSGNFNVAGTINLSAGSHVFNGGSFGGSGTLSLNGTSTVTATGGFYATFATVTHANDLNAGSGTALIIPSGTTWNCSSGSFGSFTSITNEGILNLTGDNQYHNTGANITNNVGATINWNAGGLDNGGGGQTLTNYGTFNLIGTNTIGWTTQMAIVNKSGGVIVKGGTAPAGLTIASPFTNESGGTVTIGSGASFTLASGGNLTNSGSISVLGAVIITGGTHVFNGGSFGGSGTLSLNGSSTVTATGGFYATFSTVTQVNDLNAGSGTALIIPSGTSWHWNSGAFGSFTGITNAGILNLASDGQHHNTSANITNSAGATINWNAGGLDNGGGGQTLTNYGTFNLIGNNPIGWTTQMAIVNKSGGVIVKGGTTSPSLNIARPFTNENGGTVTVNSGATLIFQSSGTLANDGDIVVGGTMNITQAGTYGGSFEVNAGGNLNFSNTSTNSTFSGNTLTNNGTVTIGSGRSLRFGGTSQQTLAGNGTAFTAFTVDNSSNLAITGSQNISGTLTLLNGLVMLHDGDLIVGTLSGGDSNRFFVTSGTGRLRQSVGTGAKLFPVGPTATSYNPVSLQQISGTANFAVRVGAALSIPPAGGGYVDREWTIDLLSGTANTNVTLFWSASETVGGFNDYDCAVSRHNGSQWEGLGFGLANCAGLCSRSATGVQSFSPFGVLDGLALPVELVSFKGKQLEGGKSVMLTWKTATELENKGFQIEKSLDGLDFYPIGFVAGLGNTHEAQDYEFLDDSFFAAAYYRLRQIDMDGEETLSALIFLGRNEVSAISIYPNPSSGSLSISYRFAENGDLLLQIFDESGKARITAEISDAQAGTAVLDLHGLSSGSYILKTNHRGIAQFHRIVVQN